MESIGEKLRITREANNLTLEQVSRETHVAKRFLKALEDEDFTVFPGETYAMGFLRNYAEYLGMDPEELAALYKNLKIQEQPLPMAELLDQHSARRPLIILVSVVAGLILLAGAGFLIYRAAAGRRATAEPPETLKPQAAQEFTFEEEVRTRWFTQGDVISVPLGGATYRVEVGAMGDQLALKVPGGTVSLDLGKERLVDLDGDLSPDIRVVWNDADRASAAARANLGLYKTTGTERAAALAARPSSTAPAAAAPAAGAQAAATPAPTPSTASTPAAVQPSRPRVFTPVLLASAAATKRFTLDFNFKNDCLFRFLADDGEREDRFFQKGETLTLDAKDRLVVWISNAGAARVRFEGRDFEIGRLGEVATRSIAWRKDPAADGYILEISPLN